jgi:hypothetical protein
MTPFHLARGFSSSHKASIEKDCSFAVSAGLTERTTFFHPCLTLIGGLNPGELNSNLICLNFGAMATRGMIAPVFRSVHPAIERTHPESCIVIAWRHGERKISVSRGSSSSGFTLSTLRSESLKSESISSKCGRSWMGNWHVQILRRQPGWCFCRTSRKHLGKHVVSGIMKLCHLFKA